MMSKEVECSRFYSIVEDNREWWKEYPYIISKKAEYSRFCTIVKGKEDSRKSIPISHLKR